MLLRQSLGTITFITSISARSLKQFSEVERISISVVVFLVILLDGHINFLVQPFIFGLRVSTGASRCFLIVIFVLRLQNLGDDSNAARDGFDFRVTPVEFLLRDLQLARISAHVVDGIVRTEERLVIYVGHRTQLVIYLALRVFLHRLHHGHEGISLLVGFSWRWRALEVLDLQVVLILRPVIFAFLKAHVRRRRHRVECAMRRADGVRAMSERLLRRRVLHEIPVHAAAVAHFRVHAIDPPSVLSALEVRNRLLEFGRNGAKKSLQHRLVALVARGQSTVDLVVLRKIHNFATRIFCLN